MSSELEARDDERFPVGSWWVEKEPHKNRLQRKCHWEPGRRRDPRHGPRASVPGNGGGGAARRSAASGSARRGTPETALLVESAVDALSAWSLDGLPDFGIAVSTAGVAAAMPAWTGELGLKAVLCGYDAEEAGDRAAAELGRCDGRIVRLRPEGGKDWNDIAAGRGCRRAGLPDR